MKIVSFEQARKLKELGFNAEIECEYIGKFYWGEESKQLYEKVPYDKNLCYYPALYIAEVLEWIRNEKDIPNGIWCAGEHISRGGDGIYYEVSYLNKDNIVDGMTWFDSYEDAESALLDELLIILEESK